MCPASMATTNMLHRAGLVYWISILGAKTHPTKTVWGPEVYTIYRFLDPQTGDFES